jgi:8-oxo-dGTP pyrophosphatase MutT (NUDIX family)
VRYHRSVLREEHLRRTLGALRPRRAPQGPKTAWAAVAAVLRYPEPDAPEVLFIRRTEHPGDPWSGHMAFPGGRRDPADTTLEDTAVRETHEEVGIDLRATAECLGRLHDVQAIARSKQIDLVIVPYVFVLRASVELVVQPSEVDEALWAPLGPMARGDTARTHPYVFEGRALELPAFQVGERLVWGLTHRMIDILFRELRAAER